MQEETNEKTIALYIKTGKLTAQQLQKAMKALLAQMKKQHDKDVYKRQEEQLIEELEADAEEHPFEDGTDEEEPERKKLKRELTVKGMDSCSATRPASSATVPRPSWEALISKNTTSSAPEAE